MSQKREKLQQQVNEKIENGSLDDVSSEELLLALGGYLTDAGNNIESGMIDKAAYDMLMSSKLIAEWAGVNLEVDKEDDCEKVRLEIPVADTEVWVKRDGSQDVKFCSLEQLLLYAKLFTNTEEDSVTKKEGILEEELGAEKVQECSCSKIVVGEKLASDGESRKYYFSCSSCGEQWIRRLLPDKSARVEDYSKYFDDKEVAVDNRGQQ